MAGLSMAVPRGAMVIDLSKRKRAGKALSHVETVASWNAAHPTHPRAGDGKFSATAGDVMSALQAWHSPRGGDDTGVGDWEAADLQSVKTHATNLARAIEMEQHRRKASEINAKPLTVKKPAKAIDATLASKLEAIRKRPMPGDRAFMEAELKKLTIAQIESLDSEPLPPGTKASKIEDMIRRHMGPLQSEAITHNLHWSDSTMFGKDKTALHAEFERRKKGAVERGDRDEYAALVAGYGTAGAGPGLPPEKKVAAGGSDLDDEIRRAEKELDDSWGDESIAAAREKVNRLKAVRAAGTTPNPAKPLTAKHEAELQALDAERERLAAGKPYVPDAALMAENERMASLASSLRKHQGDNENMLAALKAENLDAKQLKRLADEMNISIPPAARSKAARERYISTTAAEHSRRNGGGYNPAKPLKATRTVRSLSNDKVNDLHDIVNKKDLAPEDRDRAKAILNSMTVAQLTSYAEKNDLVLSGKTKEDKVNSLNYQLVGGRLDTQAIQGGKWMDSSAEKAISDIVANPRDGDAERLTGWLNSLKASELSDMAAKHKIKLVGRTKKEKIESFVDSAVQNKLNSEAIRESVGDALDVGGANRAFRGATHTSTKMKQLEDRVARLSVALDVENRKRKAGGSRIQSAKEGKLNRELTAAKRERDDARKQTGWAPGVHEDDANEAMDQALVDKIKQAGPTHLNTPSRTTGDGQFWGGHYHGDGVMGTAIERLTDEQKAININGDRLDDALADVIIEGHKGEIGVSQRQIAKFKAISAQIHDPAAKALVDQQIARLRPARVPGIDPEVFNTAPEPLRKLWKRLADVPDTGQGGKELDALADIMTRWEAGDLRAMQMEMELGRLIGLRHESQEGRFETKRAVEEAMGEVKAMMPALRARQGGRRERESTRNALEEARANLESQYGEDPDRWPEARQDREVEAYYDLRDKLRRLGG